MHDPIRRALTLQRRGATACLEPLVGTMSDVITEITRRTRPAMDDCFDWSAYLAPFGNTEDVAEVIDELDAASADTMAAVQAALERLIEARAHMQHALMINKPIGDNE